VAFEAAVFHVVTVVTVVAVMAADFHFVAVVAIVVVDSHFVAFFVSTEVKAAAAVGLVNIDTVVSFVGNNLVEFATIDFTLAIFEAFVFVIVDAFVFTFSIAS
jgi:hypothetical protein